MGAAPETPPSGCLRGRSQHLRAGTHGVHQLLIRRRREWLGEWCSTILRCNTCSLSVAHSSIISGNVGEDYGEQSMFEVVKGRCPLNPALWVSARTPATPPC